MKEVEILEQQDNSKFLFSQSVQIKTAYKDVATAIVNGTVVESQKIELQVLVCPTCNHILAELKDATTVSIMKELATISEEQEKEFAQYCPKCGQKLRYRKEVVASY